MPGGHFTLWVWLATAPAAPPTSEQVTALSAMGTPGRVQSFSAKTPAGVTFLASWASNATVLVGVLSK